MVVSVIIVETKSFESIFNISFPIGFEKLKYFGMLDLKCDSEQT